MDMLITDSSRRPTVMELLNYPVIEVSKPREPSFGALLTKLQSELKAMKREAYAVCNGSANDSATVSNAASTIQVIR